MAAAGIDSLNTLRTMSVRGEVYHYYSLAAAEQAGAGRTMRMPRSLKVLYENLLRHEDGVAITKDDLLNFAARSSTPGCSEEVLYHPSRLMLVDSSGIPLVADLAALRGAMVRNGGDPAQINPTIPCDLIIDHSVMVDHHAAPDALDRNLDLEYARNGARYRLLRWAQKSFENLRIVPPGTGICHQVNLEALARGLSIERDGERTVVAPETLLGMDSHTPMINCLGIMGWGVGGLDGGAAMLGMPVSMIFPRVVGCRLDGALQPGVTSTDLVLMVTRKLREFGVVAAFVEFFGPGLANLRLADRATLANMAPEYGATMGFFPVDEETLRYLEQTGRHAHLPLLRAYAQEQGLWHDPEGEQPDYNECVDIDISEAVPCIAGPSHPHDHLPLGEAPRRFDTAILPACAALPSGGVPVQGTDWALNHGDIVIAAIASCTNTSNPSVMLGAGLLARNAVARGLRVPPWVKTSLTPGSRIVADYLRATGLQDALDELGFHVAGFGCMTCTGNSGPLAENVERAIQEFDVTAAAVLSGNRNFAGRIHPLARTNFICSPPLVVAYALAGSMRVDLLRDPLGIGRDGQPVFLRDVWPSAELLDELMHAVLAPERYETRYAGMFDGDGRWHGLDAPEGALFEWPDDTYMKEPPFFDGITPELPVREDIVAARPLAIFGDGISTDHISPIGAITPTSAAGQYLLSQGVKQADFNSFGARRVNHEVMIRGTFANIRIRNEMVPDREGGWTRHEPSGKVMPIHEAAARYEDEGHPRIVVAGREYGQGSSRDWAAKGAHILGVRAVVAEGFERIHRSNLVGMGVLPLQFPAGCSRTTLMLDGSETFDVLGIAEMKEPRAQLTMVVRRRSGETATVPLLCRLDTALELEYFRNGGILHYAVRRALAEGRGPAAA